MDRLSRFNGYFAWKEFDKLYPVIWVYQQRNYKTLRDQEFGFKPFDEKNG